MAIAGEPAFGDLLPRHRRAAGLTQEELAERAGLSTRRVSDLERGARRRPHPETVRLLADALALAHVGDDPTVAVRTLGKWGLVEVEEGDLDQSAALIVEGMALVRANVEGMALVRANADQNLLWMLGNPAPISALRADDGRAAALAEEQLALARARAGRASSGSRRARVSASDVAARSGMPPAACRSATITRVTARS